MRISISLIEAEFQSSADTTARPTMDSAAYGQYTQVLVRRTMFLQPIELGWHVLVAELLEVPF